jgi:ribosome-associated protein
MTQPLTLAKKIAHFMLTKKARDVVMMDVRGLTDIADFFVIGTADSDVQVKAIADAVMDGTEKLGSAAWHTEGMAERQWALLDYVDVVAHVFHKDARKFYGLEKLWGDAKITEIKDEEKPVKLTRKTTKRKK